MRHKIEKNKKEMRRDRNECLHLEIIKKLKKICPVKDSDFYSYRSTFDLITNLSYVFDISDKNIYVDAGSENILKNIIITRTEISTWVVQDPTFELFLYYGNLYNKKIIKIKTFPFSRDKISTKNSEFGLYLVSPHNPTGIKYSEKEIISFCKDFKIVILDEAYLNPSKKQVKKLPNNLIIVKTFSKMGAITGFRVGFCLANKKIIETLNQTRPMFMSTYSLRLAEYLTTKMGIKLLNKIESDFEKIRKKQKYAICSEGNFILTKDFSIVGREYTFDGIRYNRITIKK